MKKEWRTLILTTLVCLLPLLAGAAVYSRLPESMATHWGFNGEPNGWSSRVTAVFVLPGVLTALNFLCFFALHTDPKRANMSPALRTIALWIPAAVSLLSGGAILAGGLGYRFRIDRYVTVFLGLLFIAIGNYLPKTRQNYTIGIRLPWTLHSEENWNRTHRLAGFLWVLAGFSFIILSFIGVNLIAFTVLLILMTLLPAAYSYLLYRRGIR